MKTKLQLIGKAVVYCGIVLAVGAVIYHYTIAEPAIPQMVSYVPIALVCIGTIIGMIGDRGARSS